jgi:hypothetical protein
MKRRPIKSQMYSHLQLRLSVVVALGRVNHVYPMIPRCFDQVLFLDQKLVQETVGIITLTASSFTVPPIVSPGLAVRTTTEGTD